jgi:hypothetical protein
MAASPRPARDWRDAILPEGATVVVQSEVDALEGPVAIDPSVGRLDGPSARGRRRFLRRSTAEVTRQGHVELPSVRFVR